MNQQRSGSAQAIQGALPLTDVFHNRKMFIRTALAALLLLVAATAATHQREALTAKHAKAKPKFKVPCYKGEPSPCPGGGWDCCIVPPDQQ